MSFEAKLNKKRDGDTVYDVDVQKTSTFLNQLGLVKLTFNTNNQLADDDDFVHIVKRQPSRRV